MPGIAARIPECRRRRPCGSGQWVREGKSWTNAESSSLLRILYCQVCGIAALLDQQYPSFFHGFDTLDFRGVAPHHRIQRGSNFREVAAIIVESCPSARQEM